MSRTILYYLLSLFLFTGVLAEEYGLNPVAKTDTVFFRSSARLEFIQGNTNEIIGGFQIDPDNHLEHISGFLRVDLRTLKTGIETRDSHMRDNHLHTDRYPYAYFELLHINNIPEIISNDSTYTVAGDGFFYIHGVKRHLSPEISFRAHYNPDGNKSIWIRASFQINLDEYKIDRPRALFLKLAKTIEVEVTFTAYNNLSITPFGLPNWGEIQ